MTALDDYRHRAQVHIRIDDIDAFNHVNNARYMSLFNTARFHYFMDLGLMQPDERPIGFLVARMCIDFKMPLSFGDDVAVYTCCTRIGNKSLDLDHALVRGVADGEQIAAEASSTIVTANARTLASIPVPTTWRETITAYEKLRPAI